MHKNTLAIMLKFIFHIVKIHKPDIPFRNILEVYRTTMNKLVFLNSPHRTIHL